jgi:hypothetical protein
MGLQVTTSQDRECILPNTLQVSSMLPHFPYMSIKLITPPRHHTCIHLERSAHEHTWLALFFKGNYA